MRTGEKFAWILSGGSSLNHRPNQLRNYRVHPRASPIILGENVQANHGEKSEIKNWESCNQANKAIHTSREDCANVPTG